MMRTSSTLAIATALLLVTSGAALAQGEAASTDPDCNRVFKANAASEKKISSNQLARDLNLPIEKVNECLLILRRGPARTPEAAK
jgi:hypothetical protein